MNSLLSHIPRIPGYLPVTRDNYELLLRYWKYFPTVAIIQLATPWYPTGKTSISSALNLPGRMAWMIMEIPSPTWLLLTTLTVSEYNLTPLPMSHIILVAMYLIHYSNRAVIGPLLNSTMSPMHLLVLLAGLAFNFVNPVIIGAWLGGYGRVTTSSTTFLVGVAIWALGFYGNLYHEKILRSIRAQSDRIAEKDTNEQRTISQSSADVKVVQGRVYMIPRGGLFEYILYPHYFCEWIEWAGFTLAAGGTSCLPALLFLVNEVSTMLPRAIQGKRWYKQKFGEKLPKDRKAAIPFLI